MDEHTLTLLRCNFDKLKDVLRCFVTLIEEHLRFLILPKEGQVDDTETLPLVLELFSCAVNYSGNFVHLDKVQVLNRKITRAEGECKGTAISKPSKEIRLFKGAMLE